MRERDYNASVIAATEVGRIEPLDERMRAITNVLHQQFADTGFAWLGFYRIGERRDEMTLVTCRPKPACSPIGLHGVCGRAWRERRPQIVADVHALGDDHIVCDPANLSEVVVPCLDPSGECYAVLDVDSRELASFSPADARGLERVLRAARLTA